MPPKRKSTDADPSKAKRPKAYETNPAVEAELKPILDKRWSPVSVTRNADFSFRMRTRDRGQAFTYVCLGRPPWRTEIFAGEDECENENEGQEEREKRKKADEAEADDKTALKPASEHPNEKWIVTNAGFAKWIALRQQNDVRNPESFDMWLYNDYFGYAIQQSVENLLVDFDEAADDWRMQWAICEATGLYFQMEAIQFFLQCDDGETVNEVCNAFGTMFLAMLATLERHDLLKPDSEVKNIGAVMGSFIRVIVDFEDHGIDWEEHDSKIKAYAAKHGIKIHGLNHPRYEKSSGQIEIPEATAGANDPWGWKTIMTKLQEQCGSLGGDSHDITSWTSAERKKSACDRKDPLSRSVINHIKAGQILSLG